MDVDVEAVVRWRWGSANHIVPDSSLLEYVPVGPPPLPSSPPMVDDDPISHPRRQLALQRNLPPVVVPSPVLVVIVFLDDSDGDAWISHH